MKSTDRCGRNLKYHKIHLIVFELGIKSYQAAQISTHNHSRRLLAIIYFYASINQESIFEE